MSTHWPYHTVKRIDGKLRTRLSTDPVMQAIEFSVSEYGMQRAVEVARGTYAAQFQPQADAERVRLGSLPGAQVREHLEQILLGPRVEEALQWLQEAGILAVVLPEMEATVDFAQEAGRRHKDVWKHTKQVVSQSQCTPAIRWAALLHDIGKVPTRVLLPDGKVTFYGHAEVGARMFDRIAKRMAFPKPLREQVRYLILFHLRANAYDGSWTDSAVRRFDREMGAGLEDLLLLSQADITSARPGKRENAIKQLEELYARILALREIDARQPPLPSGIGDLMMKEFGLKPGRHIGTIKQKLEAAIEAGAIESHQDIAYYVAYLKQHPEMVAIL